MAVNQYGRIQQRFQEYHEHDQRFNADIVFTVEGVVPGLDDDVFHFGAPPHILGPLTIRRTIGTVAYRAVWLSARSLDPINRELMGDFLDLCREAGSSLSRPVIERYGLPDDVRPELRWLGFVLETLRDYKPRFVEHRKLSASAGDPWETDKLVKPFLACARAIEVGGLLPDSQKPASPVTPAEKKRRRVQWLAEAMLLVQENPGWKDRRIAQAVGVSPSTISRSEPYQMAAALARGDKSDRPRGYVDAKTGMLDGVSYDDDWDGDE